MRIAMANSKSRSKGTNGQQGQGRPVVNEEITDILLMDGEIEQRRVPEAEKVDEIIYELVVEDQNQAVANGSDNKDDLTQKISELSSEQLLMKQQLEKAVDKSKQLSRRLERLQKSKKKSSMIYIALIVAIFAIIIAVMAFMKAGNKVNERSDALDFSKKTVIESQPFSSQEPIENMVINKDELDETVNNLLTVNEEDEPDIILTDNLNTKQLDKVIIDTAALKKESKISEDSKEALKQDVTVQKLPEVIVDEKKTHSEKKEVSLITKQHKDGQLITRKIPTLSAVKSVDKVVAKKIPEKVVAKKQVDTWVVGLGSFKNAAVAKNKASEYRRAGVPVTVVNIEVSGKTWHRISTKAFATRKDALTYAEQAKKTLKIGAVLVVRGAI